MRRARALVVATVAVAGLLGPGTAPAGAGTVEALGRPFEVTVTELPTLGGATARPWSIDERGRVAGVSETASGEAHAALWVDGEPVDLTPELTGAPSEARFVNRRGLVTGVISRQLLLPRGFVWERGTSTELPSESTSIPADLNERGQVLYATYDYANPNGPLSSVWRDGRVDVAPPLPDGAPLLSVDISDRGLVLGLAGYSANYLATWRPGEAPVALPNPEGAAGALPAAISDRDDVVGTAFFATPEPRARVVRWRNGVPTDIGTLGGASSGVADPTNTALTPVNRRGDIVGGSETATGEYHAFLWRNGRMTDLGTLGGTFSAAYGVNDAGQVVGISDLAEEFVQHPFLWQDGRMLDLTTVPGLEHLVEVADINDRGQLVGVVDGPDTEPRAVLVRVSR